MYCNSIMIVLSVISFDSVSPDVSSGLQRRIDGIGQGTGLTSVRTRGPVTEKLKDSPVSKLITRGAGSRDPDPPYLR